MTIEALNLDSLVKRTVFLKIDCGVFGNLRKADVEIKSDANENRLKHQKQLLDSPELKAINKADVQIRAAVDLYTSSFSKTLGIRIVPLAAAKQVNKMLKEYKSVYRPQLVADFKAAYTAQVEDAKLQLKEHFNINDYPSIDQVESEFKFEYSFVTFAVPEHLKTVDVDAFEAEKQKSHAMFVEAVNELVIGLRAGAKAVVDELLVRLSAKKSDGQPKKLREGAVADLLDFLNRVDILNVTDDKELKHEMATLKALTAGVDADKISNSETLRLDLQTKFAEVSKTLGTLTEVKGRKFRDAPAAAAAGD